MRIFSRFLLASVCVFAPQSAAFAAGHATSVQAQALEDKAVAELQTAGPDKAFAAFNDANGAYKYNDLYVFVFNMKGDYEASGANPKLVGTNALDMTDAEGKHLVQEMIAVAKRSGHGRVSYIWLNRADNRVEHKVSLVRRVGDHIVGVGYYHG